MYLSSLNDCELSLFADSTLDSLTSTELERELLKRFNQRLAQDDEDQPLVDALAQCGVEFDDLVEIIKTLDEFHVADVDSLKEKLTRADKFYAIANDSGDVFQRLTSLINETL
ncbi:hypothetical protein SKTS_19210 [Sulfurimicrobium lacus]|uniref:Uncharacterized protein n=1 Tax=Sulfurimicrobium lacus TaxID=2715678 RepID=A0A6F8VE50_9PROT|nr:hypothetical protein [Sulfurimicrobium lacus]BCB27035.1 hypothetical protein SKTS_19210 [Sulfurimicrobium lacus]